MKRSSPTLLSAVMLATTFGTSALAQVTVNDPWVRATVPEQKATGAFMQLSAPAGARLIEVRSSVAGVAELHEMSMEGTTMKMRAIPGIELPAGTPVELRPGGYHVMLMDLKHQLREGETVPITLVVEGKDKKRETLEVKAPVRQLNTAAGNTPKR